VLDGFNRIAAEICRQMQIIGDDDRLRHMLKTIEEMKAEHGPASEESVIEVNFSRH
jgi:hypothetical protein